MASRLFITYLVGNELSLGKLRLQHVVRLGRMRLVFLQAVIRAAILLELLTFSLSVLFMLVAAVSTLVPPWSTLAFIGDATLCPLGNSSVPMKLSAGRKSTEGKEDSAVLADAFLHLPSPSRSSSRCFFLDHLVAFTSLFDSRWKYAFLQQIVKKVRIVRYACVTSSFTRQITKQK